MFNRILMPALGFTVYLLFGSWSHLEAATWQDTGVKQADVDAAQIPKVDGDVNTFSIQTVLDPASSPVNPVFISRVAGGAVTVQYLKQYEADKGEVEILNAEIITTIQHVCEPGGAFTFTLEKYSKILPSQTGAKSPYVSRVASSKKDSYSFYGVPVVFIHGTKLPLGDGVLPAPYGVFTNIFTDKKNKITHLRRRDDENGLEKALPEPHDHNWIRCLPFPDPILYPHVDGPAKIYPTQWYLRGDGNATVMFDQPSVFRIGDPSSASGLEMFSEPAQFFPLQAKPKSPTPGSCFEGDTLRIENSFLTFLFINCCHENDPDGSYETPLYGLSWTTTLNIVFGKKWLEAGANASVDAGFQAGVTAGFVVIDKWLSAVDHGFFPSDGPMKLEP